MSAQMVLKAIDQSRTREPLVNSMALLTWARVLAYMDLRTAKRVFEEGISVFENLGLHAHTASILRHEIIQIAVPVDPEMAAVMYLDGRAPIGGLAVHGFTAFGVRL